MSTSRKLKKLNIKDVNPQERDFVLFLEKNVVGQPAALAALGRAYRSGLSPIANPRRPRAVLLFAGPSRSGKSFSVECAAEFCHGSPDAMIELEGGDLQLEHQVIKLTGAPPSYVGYKPPADSPKDGEAPKIDPSAKLAPANLDASRHGSKCPIVWIRINEIEKAHEALYDLLLGATDNGKIHLGNNQQVDLSNCVIVMTSNLGMKELQRKPIGFLIKEKTTSDVQSAVDNAMAFKFRPEFRNRIDEVVVFNPLSKEDVRKVVGVEVMRLQDRILKQMKRGQMFVITVDDPAKDFILDQADNSNGGVADMKRTFKRLLEDPLANEILKGTINLGDKVVVTYEGGDELSFYLDHDGTIVAGADKMEVVDSPETKEGLAFQRSVALVPAGDRVLFDLIEQFPSTEGMMEKVVDLIHDLQKVFGIAMVAYGCRLEAPCLYKVTVRANNEQIRLLKTKYPELTVERNTSTTPKKG